MKEIKQNNFNVLKNTISIVLDFIYPDNISCILCDKPINKTNTYSMCKDCFSEMNFIVDGCIKCGKPIINHSLEKQDISGCSYCFNKSFYFDKAISCIEYTKISKKLIFKFKYHNSTYMSKYIATIMKEKLELENIKFEYILFVPLHKKRQRKRGFNQSQKIAKKLSEMINVPVLDKIQRIVYTKSLFKLSKVDRYKELKNTFTLNDNEQELKNKNILLVDDILTTGSTVNEISKILKLNGVNKVFVITLLTGNNDCFVMA